MLLLVVGVLACLEEGRGGSGSGAAEEEVQFLLRGLLGGLACFYGVFV
jgi:hypothetical protein